MIKILTEGSSKYGFGHIIRCLSLINYCGEKNIECQIYVDGDDSSKEIIKENNGILINWKCNKFIKEHVKRNDIVITDSYHATLQHYDLIKIKAKRLLIIDDLYRLPYKGFTIINPNFCAEILERDEANNHYLYGENYILLRNDFIGKKNDVLNEKVRRVMVTLGGSDLLNMTPKIISYLIKINRKIAIDVVIGFGYDNIREIKAVCTNQVNLHYNISAVEMAKLMVKCDFAISATGQTVNEMLKIGCPGCFIKVIDNQQLNLDYIQKSERGLIFNMNDFKNIHEMFKYEVRSVLKEKLVNIENENTGAFKILKYIKESGFLER